MTTLPRDHALDAYMTKVAARKDTRHVSAAMIQPSTGWSWHWREPDAPEQYFIASITKLYTTAITMQLRAEGALTLGTPAHAILGPDAVDGLHTYRGQDYSREMTVEHLLRQNTGLGDYFEGKRADGTTLFKQILEHDAAWTREDIWEWVRGIEGRFPPGTPGKAHYSDTNYQLLGAIIETLDGRTYEESLRARVIEPLGHQQTYLYTHDTHDRFDEIAGMRYGTKPITLPQALASFGPDGSVVSTAQEQVSLLHAFMTGKLFPVAYVDDIAARYTRIFYPMEYGMGIMRFKLSRIASPFQAIPPFVGHSGASGVVTYYIEDKDLYIALVSNQVKSQGLVHRLLAQLQTKVPAI